MKMTNNNTWVDVHILQTLPPNNLNRDDTGSPKTAVYGGTERARVSSQAWKRATRQHFEKNHPVEKLAQRTKRVVEQVLEHVSVARPDLDHGTAVALSENVLTAAGIKLEAPKKASKDDDGSTEPYKTAKFLIFLSNAQAAQLAAVALEAYDADDEKIKAAEHKKAAKAAFKENQSLDLALFGRMVADDPSLNVDAACQVAHAISVHPVVREYDYYTAVDDRNADDESGAGMIGTLEFNSSTLYRYATVDTTSLRENLGDNETAARSVAAFVESFAESLPTGKATTFAPNTYPEAVVVVVRSKRPVSLAQAFEFPSARSDDASRVTVATKDFVEHYQDTNNAYGDDVVSAFVVRVGKNTAALDGIASPQPMSEVLAELQQVVAERLGAANE